MIQSEQTAGDNVNKSRISDREMLSGGRGRRFKSYHSDQYLDEGAIQGPLVIPLAKPLAPPKAFYPVCRAPGSPNPWLDKKNQLEAECYKRGIKRTEAYFTYFIREPLAGAIKIGIAYDVLVRMTTLQAAHPYELKLIGRCAGGVTLERALHAEFAADRLLGEWFLPSEPLLERIRGLCSPKAPKRRLPDPASTPDPYPLRCHGGGV